MNSVKNFQNFREMDSDDINWRPGIRLYNDLEKLDTDTKLLLVKHLKKIKKRVYFNENNIQKIILEKWKLSKNDQLEIPFDYDDNKYNELRFKSLCKCQTCSSIYW